MQLSENSMFQSIAAHGFLPATEPKSHFPEFSEFTLLDTLGCDLPSMLEKSNFREQLKKLTIPEWSEDKYDIEN